MLRVLVVEDSSSMRTFVRASLEAASMAVVEASAGFEALRFLARERFDVVIIDVNMPTINGLELVALMRRGKDHSETPILLISTDASQTDRARGLELGANAFLSKPFGADTLEAEVRRLALGEA